ncbi:MAG: Zn-ribbon domain-containing OB-fold protein [Myxococcota bacterium]
MRLAWEAVSGRGRIHIFTVAHRAPHPKFAGQLPLVIAIVELEEGPRLVTNLVDRNPEKIEVGAAVEVRFEAIEDSDVSLPVFILLT